MINSPTMVISIINSRDLQQIHNNNKDMKKKYLTPEATPFQVKMDNIQITSQNKEIEFGEAKSMDFINEIWDEEDE